MSSHRIVVLCAALFVGISFFVPPALAQDAAPTPWAHESELALVTTTGNSETDSLSAKQKSTYKFDRSGVTSTARFLRSSTSGTETARSWDAGLRYDFSLSDSWSLFVGGLLEAEPYAGIVQRNSADFGSKYVILKNDEINWVSELGLRYSDTYNTSFQHESATFVRLYSEASAKVNESVSAKLWAEYLPNLKAAEAYLANGEASFTTIMSKVFSLKLAYLARYQNEPQAPGAKRLDTVFTTSLVARF